MLYHILLKHFWTQLYICLVDTIMVDIFAYYILYIAHRTYIRMSTFYVYVTLQIPFFFIFTLTVTYK